MSSVLLSSQSISLSLDVTEKAQLGKSQNHRLIAPLMEAIWTRTLQQEIELPFQSVCVEFCLSLSLSPSLSLSLSLSPSLSLYISTLSPQLLMGPTACFLIAHVVKSGNFPHNPCHLLRFDLLNPKELC